MQMQIQLQLKDDRTRKLCITTEKIYTHKDIEELKKNIELIRIKL